MNISLIIIIGSCVLIFGIILYFIITNNSNNSKDKTNINPTSSCPENLSQCGTGCYDKNKEACDINKQICQINQYITENNLCCNDGEQSFEITSIDAKDNKKINGYTCCDPEKWSSIGNTCCPKKLCNGLCCLDSKYCDYDLKNNSCIDCPTKLCPDIDGGKCCQKGEKCYQGPTGATGIYSQVCCSPDLWDPENKVCCTGVNTNKCIKGGSTGYKGCNCNIQQTCINYTCCDNIYNTKDDTVYSCVNELGEDICCPGKNEDDILSKCSLMNNGKYMCCQNTHIFNKDNQKCGIPCGNDICDIDTQNAFTVEDGDCICVSKGCEWKDYTYTPPILKDSNNNSIDVCSVEDTSLNTKKYYTVNNPIGNIDVTKLSRTAETSESDNKNLCGSNECLYKINEKGGDIISFDKGECHAKFNCQTILPDLDNTSSGCPYDTNNNSSCCYQNGKYTGQICLDNQSCYNGNDTDYIKQGDCICSNDSDDPIAKNCKFFSRNTYCNGHGNHNLTTGKCDCDPNYLESSNCKDYNPCLNGGTWDGYQCHCIAGSFAGSNCQYCKNPGKDCVKNCSGNGIPQDNGTCICNPNNIGDICEITRESRCSSKGNPDYCQKINDNGSRTVDKTCTYCKCDSGFTGNTCEHPSTVCDPGFIVDLGPFGNGNDWKCACMSNSGIYYNDRPPFCKPQFTCQSFCLQNYPNTYQQCMSNCR